MPCVGFKCWRELVEGVELEVLEFADAVEFVEKASRLSGGPPSKVIKHCY